MNDLSKGADPLGTLEGKVWVVDTGIEEGRAIRVGRGNSMEVTKITPLVASGACFLWTCPRDLHLLRHSHDSPSLPLLGKGYFQLGQILRSHI